MKKKKNLKDCLVVHVANSEGPLRGEGCPFIDAAMPGGELSIQKLLIPA